MMAAGLRGGHVIAPDSGGPRRWPAGRAQRRRPDGGGAQPGAIGESSTEPIGRGGRQTGYLSPASHGRRPVPHFQYTALPLATLTLTAHTRPAPPPRGPAADRDNARAESDGGVPEAAEAR